MKTDQGWHPLSRVKPPLVFSSFVRPGRNICAKQNGQNWKKIF